jgi:nucleoid-associated protein YgaU
MLALEIGRVQVRTAMHDTGFNLLAAVQEMRTWFPEPTGTGQATIVAILDDVASVQTGMEAALANVLNTEIQSVVDELIAEGALRLKPGAVQPGPASPTPTTPQPNTSPAVEQLYTVQPGDWLSTIAEKYYGDPMRYPEIFDANAHRVPGFTDPNDIQVGWSLLIP